METAPTKPHRCMFCDKNFRKLEHLQRHRRTHTKEKPFACECGDAFSRRDLLQRHKRIHHQNHATHSSTRSPEDGSQQRSAIVENGTNFDLCSDSNLPLPPEYYHLGSSCLGSQQAGDVMTPFENFFQSSGFRHIADSLQSRIDPQGELPQGLAGETPRPSSDFAHVTSLSIAGPSGTHPHAESVRTLLLTHTASATLDAALTNTDALEDMWRAYHPGSAPPSRQTCRRYQKAYENNVRNPLVHRIVKLENLHVALRTAMLALGALHLFEHRSARLLFDASKTTALSASPASLREESDRIYDSQSQLASTFILLTDYVKLAQPLNSVEELSGLYGGLLSCSGSFTAHDCGVLTSHPRPPVTAEMARRTHVFAFCVLTVQSALFGFPYLSMTAGNSMQLPCSQKDWEQVDDAYVERGEAKSIVTHLNTLMDMNHGEHGSLSSKYEFHSVIILIMLAIQRIHVTSEASQLPALASHARLAHLQFFQVLELLSSALDAQQIRSEDCTTSLAQAHDVQSLVHLVSLRSTSFMKTFNSEIYRLNNPLRLSEALCKWLAASPTASERPLLVVFDSVRLIEGPAETGFAYFLRRYANSWGLESVLSAFESVLLLSKWMTDLPSATTLGSDITKLLERLRNLVSMAWSSVDDTGELPVPAETEVLAQQYARYWARLLGALENKPFAHLLGQTLEIYAQDLGNSQTQ